MSTEILDLMYDYVPSSMVFPEKGENVSKISIFNYEGLGIGIVKHNKPMGYQSYKHRLN